MVAASGWPLHRAVSPTRHSPHLVSSRPLRGWGLGRPAAWDDTAAGASLGAPSSRRVSRRPRALRLGGLLRCSPQWGIRWARRGTNRLPQPEAAPHLARRRARRGRARARRAASIGARPLAAGPGARAGAFGAGPGLGPGTLRARERSRLWPPLPRAPQPAPVSANNVGGLEGLVGVCPRVTEGKAGRLAQG